MRALGRISRVWQLVVALVVIACGGPTDAHEYSVSFPGVGRNPAVPMVLTDQAGLVSAVRVYRPEPGELPVEVTNPRGDLSTLAVKWLGLDCDRSISATLERSVEGLIRVAVEVDRHTDCLLAGVERAVLLTLNEPIPAGRVVFEERGG